MACVGHVDTGCRVVCLVASMGDYRCSGGGELEPGQRGGVVKESAQ